MRYKNDISASDVNFSSILFADSKRIRIFAPQIKNKKQYGRQQRDCSSHSTAHRSISSHWSRSMYVFNLQFHR